MGGAPSTGVLDRAEELDPKPHRTERFDLMRHAGRNGLRRTGGEDDVRRWRGLGPKPEFARLDADPPPRAGSDPVGSPQTKRRGQLIPCVGDTDDAEVLGQLEAIAQDAVKGGPHPLVSRQRIEHPGRQPERRIVTNVLPMKADQLRHPVTRIILYEPDDVALHAGSVGISPSERRLRSFQQTGAALRRS